MTKIGNSKPASQGLKYVFNPSTTQACPPFVRDILPKYYLKLTSNNAISSENKQY